MANQSEKILVDSNFFIALFNPPDTLHQEALKISHKFRKETPELYISNFIFLEIVTVLAQRIGRTAAISLGDHLLKDKQLRVIHIDRRLNELTWEVFKGIKKKNISFVDCSILALIKTEGIRKLLTFDREDFALLRNVANRRPGR